MHCATDGESYGHHSRFGEMALASALERLEADDSVHLTNYGAFLAAHPPRWEAQIHENTSWSCAHGVERWRADCGCRVRGDWHQSWRGPLRRALDHLRDQVDTFYETRAGALLKDPWEARDDYASVARARSPERGRLLAQSPDLCRANPSDPALRSSRCSQPLLCTTRAVVLHEYLGIEPCRYSGSGLANAVPARLGAAGGARVIRSVHGAQQLRLAEARGYSRCIAPACRHARVVAHTPAPPLRGHPEPRRVRLHVSGDERRGVRRTALRSPAAVSSRLTGEAREAMYAVLHFGGHDFACGIRGYDDHAVYDRMKSDLLRRYSRYTLADMVRGMDEHFPGEGFSLNDLFLEERRRVLAFIIRGVLDRHEETYRRIWEDNRKLMRYLHAADAPIPDALALVGRHVSSRTSRAMANIDESPRLPERVAELLAEAKDLGLTLDLTPSKLPTTRAVTQALQAVAEEPSPTRVARAAALVTDALRLDLRFSRWDAQNRFFAIWRARPDAHRVLAPLATALGFNLTNERR